MYKTLSRSANLLDSSNKQDVISLLDLEILVPFSPLHTCQLKFFSFLFLRSRLDPIQSFHPIHQ